MHIVVNRISVSSQMSFQKFSNSAYISGEAVIQKCPSKALK
jgi:hypothetical protein